MWMLPRPLEDMQEQSVAEDEQLILNIDDAADASGDQLNDLKK